MKVALIQMSAGPDKAVNLKKALNMVSRALEAKAEFVLLPEVFNSRTDIRDPGQRARVSEQLPGDSVEELGLLASQYRAAILLGSILEKALGGKAYNTSVLLGPDGSIAAKYRKIHLFDARLGDKIIREADILVAGRKAAMATVGAFKVGLSICYDLRFPDFYRKYGRQGATVLTAPSCFTQKTGQAHWEVLLRARAIENLCYVLAPNQVGEDHRGIVAYGNSMVVSPWGEVVARGSDEGEEIIFSNISIEEVKKARAMLPGVVSGFGQ